MVHASYVLPVEKIAVAVLKGIILMDILLVYLLIGAMIAILASRARPKSFHLLTILTTIMFWPIVLLIIVLYMKQGRNK